jgi:hypothetical protein
MYPTVAKTRPATSPTAICADEESGSPRFQKGREARREAGTVKVARHDVQSTFVPEGMPVTL